MMGKRWKNILINGVYIIEETANSRKALIEQNKNENEGQYIERTAYNMGDNSKKEQFAIRNRTAEGWCVCVLVVTCNWCIIIYLLYITSLFLFCFVWRRPRGSDVHVYYCKGLYLITNFIFAINNKWKSIAHSKIKKQ